MNRQDFLNQVEHVYNFRHRSPIRAPGVPIGTAMVNLALQQLGEVEKLGAIAEAKACLSDAIQALTGCTVGNKYLTIYEKIGRYALTLYDRNNGNGIRVFVDLKKIDQAKMPETYKFFLRQRPREVQYDMKARAASAQLITEEVADSEWSIFGWEKVLVKNLEKETILPVKVCKKCGESYTCDDDSSEFCLVCGKELDYYEKISRGTS